MTMLIVWYPLQKNWPTWRWPIEGSKHVERRNV